MKDKGRNWAILLGVFSVLVFAGGVSAATMGSEYTWPDGFSWYGESGALRAPVYDPAMPGLWWMPDNAPAGQENTQWGNRGYVFVGTQKATPVAVAPQPAPVAVTPAPTEKTVYVDRIVEKPVEKIVYVDRVVEKPVEKIVYVDREKIVEKTVTEYVERPPVKTVKLTDIFFNYDRSNLTPLANKTLRDNLEVLNANPEVKVLLIGSASPEGTNDYNQKLSQRRVNSVGAWLLNEGVSQSRFITEAIGEIEVEKAQYPSARKVQVNITDSKTNQ